MADDDKKIDVDDLDDKAFEELKAGMVADEPPEDAEPTPEPPTEAKKAEPKQDAKSAQDDDDDADDGDDEPKDGKSNVVPHAKFHRANERAKEEARLRKEAEDRFAKLADRLAQLTEPQQPKPAEPEAPEIPDPRANPVDAISWTVDTLKQQIEQGNKTKAEQEAAAAEQTQWQRAQDFAQQQFAQAEQADPELRPAYDHLLQSFTKEAEAYGLQGADLRAHLENTERAHVRYALQNNMTIPEYVKKLSQARGFTYKPAEPEPAAKDVGQEIAEREEARKASLSLGKTGGGVSNTDKLTPERLLDMTDAEFDAYKAKHGSVGAVFYN